MALSARVKQELATVTVKRPSAKSAEVATLIRFAGDLSTGADDRLILHVTVDHPAVAQRLKNFLFDMFDLDFSVSTGAGSGGGSGYMSGSSSSGLRKSGKFQLKACGDDALRIMRGVGLITRSGMRITGLPPVLVSGSVADAEAAWRGAFLAHGSLTEPGRSSSLEITCPSPEAGLALVGCARRIGIVAKSKEVRGNDRVIVRDGDAIGALLTRMGAQEIRLEWEERRLRREVRATANRLANFDDANLRRSARAAVAAAARVERALDILGDDVPEHLAEAGALRIQHRQASLEELGKCANPPMTKDAVAGRIRRLLAMADRRAGELGIPKTADAITEDVLAEADEVPGSAE